MKTHVTNKAGYERYLGYLPQHGRKLADNGSLMLDGDLRTVLASGMGRYSRHAELASLDYDLAHGLVELAEVAEVGSSSSSSGA